jgi:hypothetical protein
MSVRTSTPDPASSVTASAISNAVSASRIDTRRANADRIAVPASALSDAVSSGRVAWSAGVRPNRMPTATAMAPVNMSTEAFR